MGDAFRVGLGGPVGAGKTSLTASLCKVFSETLSIAVITNDIYTKAVSYTHLTLPTNTPV